MARRCVEKINELNGGGMKLEYGMKVVENFGRKGFV